MDKRELITNLAKSIGLQGGRPNEPSRFDAGKGVMYADGYVYNQSMIQEALEFHKRQASNCKEYSDNTYQMYEIAAAAIEILIKSSGGGTIVLPSIK